MIILSLILIASNVCAFPMSLKALNTNGCQLEHPYYIHIVYLIFVIIFWICGDITSMRVKQELNLIQAK